MRPRAGSGYLLTVSYGYSGKLSEAPDGPGTKNGQSHRVWLPEPAQLLLSSAKTITASKLDPVMRSICAELGIADKVTPHDLRRTHGTKVTALGFGRDAMNRVQNHREGGISSVYDRHGYSEENKRIMETVATAIMALAEGRSDEKVLTFP